MTGALLACPGQCRIGIRAPDAFLTLRKYRVFNVSLTGSVVGGGSGILSGSLVSNGRYVVDSSLTGQLQSLNATGCATGLTSSPATMTQASQQ